MYSQDLSGKNEIIRNLSVSLSKHNELQSYTRSLFRKYETAGDIKLVILDAFFCDGAHCVFGKEGQSYFYDAGHLSDTGARLLADETLKVLRIKEGANKIAL